MAATQDGDTVINTRVVLSVLRLGDTFLFFARVMLNAEVVHPCLHLCSHVM